MERLPSPLTLVRLGLVLFVVAWLFGPYTLRTAVPIWLVFLIALGLELHFFVGALRPAPSRRPDRAPQAVDLERYGYRSEPEELLLVREGGEEVWVPYSGETGEELEALIAEELERPADEPDVVATDPERRRVPRALRRLLVGLGVIGALALVLWLAGRTGWEALDANARARAEVRFSDEASRIAEKPVAIRCDESGSRVGAVQHADGVAIVGGDVAYLTPQRCFELYRLAFENEAASSQTARSLAVLAHEAWHLRGERDEGTTECYALQSAVQLGQALGLDEDTARRLMRQQLTENALRSGTASEYRVPADCRDGGRLDLRPESKRFP